MPAWFGRETEARQILVMHAIQAAVFVITALLGVDEHTRPLRSLPDTLGQHRHDE
jgi:hypothetical protein